MFKFNIGAQVRVKMGHTVFPGCSGVVVEKITNIASAEPGEDSVDYVVNLDPYGERVYRENDLELLVPVLQETSPAEASDPMRQPASGTATKLRRWMELEKEVNQLKTRLQKAQVELDAAVQDLGEHLCPPNAKVDEDFHIWVGDSMVRAKITNLGHLPPKNKKYAVVPHYKGKNWGTW